MTGVNEEITKNRYDGGKERRMQESDQEEGGREVVSIVTCSYASLEQRQRYVVV